MATPERSQDRHRKCPQCSSRQLYVLADKRRKCRLCKARFTPVSAVAKLPKTGLKEICRLFWLGVPAARAAEDLGLHVNTAERRYSQLRRGLANYRQALLVATPRLNGEVEVDESYFGGHRKGKRGRGAAGKVCVFGILKRGGQVRVVFPDHLDAPTLKGAIREHVEPQSWVFSDGFRAYDNLDLEGFRHSRVDHSKTLGSGKNHINGIENFWGFAKRRLKLYHGGFKRNFALFLLEMEFRFNHRKDPNAIELLERILKGPKPTTRKLAHNPLHP